MLLAEMRVPNLLEQDQSVVESRPVWRGEMEPMKFRSRHSHACVVEMIGECEIRTGEIERTPAVIYTHAGRVFVRKKAEFMLRFNPVQDSDDGK